MSTNDPVLAVQDAVLRFGGIVALDGVTFEVEQGTTFGVIGPNGAGKTALLNCISGIYRLNSGSISLFGNAIHNEQPNRISALGLSRTFQSTDHFMHFSVLDYVMLGRLHLSRCSMFGSVVLWPIRQRSERAERRVVMNLLERAGLASYARQNLSDLPYGVQKLVDIARAMAGDAKIVLLDEPTSGTTTSEREDVSRTVRMIADSGVTTILIDHDVAFVTRHCDRLIVMNYGMSIGVGTPKEMLQRPDVVEAFLGGLIEADDLETVPE